METINTEILKDNMSKNKETLTGIITSVDEAKAKAEAEKQETSEPDAVSKSTTHENIASEIKSLLVDLKGKDVIEKNAPAPADAPFKPVPEEKSSRDCSVDNTEVHTSTSSGGVSDATNNSGIKIQGGELSGIQDGMKKMAGVMVSFYEGMEKLENRISSFESKYAEATENLNKNVAEPTETESNPSDFNEKPNAEMQARIEEAEKLKSDESLTKSIKTAPRFSEGEVEADGVKRFSLGNRGHKSDLYERMLRQIETSPENLKKNVRRNVEEAQLLMDSYTSQEDMDQIRKIFGYIFGQDAEIQIVQ